MAGHSKWANIQHRKGKQDKIRAKLFSRLSKEIMIAVKMGGPDIDGNPRLRLAVKNARSESMPKDNIQRAIDKASGAGADMIEEFRYEGFGPGGVGLIVECASDNRNRAAGDVRAAFSKNGGNMGETGSVSFGFDRVGEIRYLQSVADEDAMMEAALEAGATDVDEGESEPDNFDEVHAQHVIYCAFEDLAEVSAALEAKFGEAAGTAIIWKPQNLVPVDSDKVEGLMKLLAALEDVEDVQTVFGNYDISDEDMAKLAAA
ncbi:MAG: YebC/PmpR family DNA-binding transcriptional regulator [Maricaulaceae bacterium]